MKNVLFWVERLTALHKNLMRKVAAEEGLQLVHIEILQYLSICNHYSDTAQAITEYLGQTKGSISQSLAFLEENKFIKKNQDKNDKRVYHLALMSKGETVVENLEKRFSTGKSSDVELDQHFKAILSTLQKENSMREFGICSTCKYNQNLGGDKFKCGLTQEALTKTATGKICREHESKN